MQPRKDIKSTRLVALVNDHVSGSEISIQISIQICSLVQLAEYLFNAGMVEYKEQNSNTLIARLRKFETTVLARIQLNE
jgi:hypothetical protein